MGTLAIGGNNAGNRMNCAGSVGEKTTLVEVMSGFGRGLGEKHSPRLLDKLAGIIVQIA